MVKACQAAGGAPGMPENADVAENACNWLENQLAEKDELEAKQNESEGVAKPSLSAEKYGLEPKQREHGGELSPNMIEL
eukprot:3410493-Alexandrium_andersonii.AAC.1